MLCSHLKRASHWKKLILTIFQTTSWIITFSSFKMINNGASLGVPRFYSTCSFQRTQSDNIYSCSLILSWKYSSMCLNFGSYFKSGMMLCITSWLYISAFIFNILFATCCSALNFLQLNEVLSLFVFIAYNLSSYSIFCPRIAVVI